MLTKEEVEKAGYTILPKGGYVMIQPENFPHDWEYMCTNFGVDPECKEMVLCVCGVLEVPFEKEEDENEDV